MSQTECIFKTRCKKCDNLILKSEKHKCTNPPIPKKSRSLFLEIGLTFNELETESLKPSEICHFLNKKFNFQKYTQYEIKWHLDKNPQTFVIDQTKKYKNQYSEKYYIQLDNCSEEQKKKIEQDRTLGYHLQLPKSEWGLKYSIKKTTLVGGEKKEKTLAMVYGKELAEKLLQKCEELKA